MLRELLKHGINMYEVNRNGEIAVEQIFNKNSGSTLTKVNPQRNEDFTTPTSFLIRLLFKEFRYECSKPCQSDDGTFGYALQEKLL